MAQTTKELLDKILNDIEKAELEKFAANPTMVETVKKVLLAGIYFNGTLRPGEAADATRNFALGLVFNRDAAYTDEALGADLRASAAGIRVVEQGFDQITKLVAAQSTPKPKKNPGR